MDKKLLLYRPARVYRKRDFFCLIFYYRSTTDAPLLRYKKTFGLNKIPLHARPKAAKVMCEAVNDALAEGWKPYGDVAPDTYTLPVISGTILQATNEAWEAKKIRINRPRTISSYQTIYNRFTKWLRAEKLHDLKPENFTRAHAFAYQTHLIKKGLKPTTCNSCVELIANLFKWLEKTGVVDRNVFAAVDKLKEEESTLFAAFTDDELQRIKAHLLNVLPELWQAFLFGYYCYMRPASIVAIRAGDIDLKNCTLTVRASDHKNAKAATKQLLQAHLFYLAPYVQNLTPETLLFSKDLKSGTIKIAPTRLSEAWKVHVIDGLGIDKKFYAGKPTGAGNMIANNQGIEPLRWLQSQMSHSDLRTTSIYTNKVRVVKIDESKINIDKL